MFLSSNRRINNVCMYVCVYVCMTMMIMIMMMMMFVTIFCSCNMLQHAQLHAR